MGVAELGKLGGCEREWVYPSCLILEAGGQEDRVRCRLGRISSQKLVWILWEARWIIYRRSTRLECPIRASAKTGGLLRPEPRNQRAIAPPRKTSRRRTMHTTTMLCRALPIRHACRLQPSTVAKPASATFTTAAPRQSQSSPRQHRSSRTIVRISPSKRINFTQCRKASTSPAAPSATTSSTASEPLTWNRFLALRKTRRRISLVSSIICAAGGFGTAVILVSTNDIESMGTVVFGLDPIVVMGLSVLMGTGIGWLLGPAFGNAAFNTAYKSYRTQIAAVSRPRMASISLRIRR
jgi:mitochondrial import inner membrane translocase subunit TIM23